MLESARDQQKRLLKVSTAAEMLDVSRAHLYNLINSGVLPVVRLGRSVRIDPEDLNALIKRAKTGEIA